MKCELCNDTGSLTTDGYLDCVACDVAIQRAKFNKRLKEAGSMSVEDAAWWGRQQAEMSEVERLARKLANSYSNMLPTLYVDDEPVGRNLVRAVADHPA